MMAFFKVNIGCHKQNILIMLEMGDDYVEMRDNYFEIRDQNIYYSEV